MLIGATPMVSSAIFAITGSLTGPPPHHRRSGCSSEAASDVSAFQHTIAHALAAGATIDEIVATLEAVTPVTSAARIVQCAPKVGLALGYDVDADLE